MQNTSYLSLDSFFHLIFPTSIGTRWADINMKGDFSWLGSPCQHFDQLTWTKYTNHYQIGRWQDYERNREYFAWKESESTRYRLITPFLYNLLMVLYCLQPGDHDSHPGTLVFISCHCVPCTLQFLHVLCLFTPQ